MQIEKDNLRFKVNSGDDVQINVDGKPINFSRAFISEDTQIVNAQYYPAKEVEIIINGEKQIYKINTFKYKFSCFIEKSKVLCGYFVRGIKILWQEDHFILTPSRIKDCYQRLKKRIAYTGPLYANPFNKVDYAKWFKEHHVVVDKDNINPVGLSVVIPIYNVQPMFLERCLDSIISQDYPNLEICLVDDCSSKLETIECIKKYAEKYDFIKVKFREENGHISQATNDAIELATNEYIIFCDNDDELVPNALWKVAEAINEHPNYDVYYSDEDKIDVHGNVSMPNFKPNYSPDTLMGINYICHLCIIRKDIIEKVGGLRVGYEGVQDHDLLLRISEISNRFYHIPYVLYHWRMIEGSTALSTDQKNYAAEKGIKMIKDALNRRGLQGDVSLVNDSTLYLVNYKNEEKPLITIIIPAKDKFDVTKCAIDSIEKLTTYKNYEILLVDNNSVEEKTKKGYESLIKEYDNITITYANYEFNYARINNEAVEKANGEYVVLLNNDVEIISPDWLENLLGYAQLEHVGAVGAKLLYPDTTIQHAGIYLGIGGVATHAYWHQPLKEKGVYGRLLIPYNYSAVTGACLMIKKSKYVGMDENLAVAFNDVDFCLQLLDKGYYNICLPQVTLTHYESISRGFVDMNNYNAFIYENNYLNKKWSEFIKNDPFYNPNYSKDIPEKLDIKR